MFNKKFKVEVGTILHAFKELTQAQSTAILDQSKAILALAEAAERSKAMLQDCNDRILVLEDKLNEFGVKSSRS